MASELIGRAPCPECDFAHAHIKIKTDKEGARPYRHCPECGSQYFPRSTLQADNLKRTITKPTVPQAAPPVADKPQDPVPVPEKKRRVVFGVEVEA